MAAGIVWPRVEIRAGLMSLLILTFILIEEEV
jgi:hypothetical protein